MATTIPQPTVSAIVHWLIQIILVVGVAVGVGFLLFIGGEKLYSGYKEHFADQISLAELPDQLCRGGVLCGADQGSPASQSSFAPADLSWGVYGYPAVYKRLAES